jgi:hypothetical protein
MPQSIDDLANRVSAADFWNISAFSLITMVNRNKEPCLSIAFYFGEDASLVLMAFFRSPILT